MSVVFPVRVECDGCINHECDPFQCNSCINGSNWEGESTAEELSYAEFKDLVFPNDD